MTMRPVHFGERFMQTTLCHRTINRSMSVRYDEKQFGEVTCADCKLQQKCRVSEALAKAQQHDDAAFEAVAAIMEPGVPVALLAQAWKLGWAARDLKR